jgi:hypothetical protein
MSRTTQRKINLEELPLSSGKFIQRETVITALGCKNRVPRLTIQLKFFEGDLSLIDHLSVSTDVRGTLKPLESPTLLGSEKASSRYSEVPVLFDNLEEKTEGSLTATD